MKSVKLELRHDCDDFLMKRNKFITKVLLDYTWRKITPVGSGWSRMTEMALLIADEVER